jgi:hypothetical protein
MWHSCGKFSLEDLFAHREPNVAKLFRQFAKMVRACGPVHMIPQKTRVVFQVRMRFAGVTPRKSHLICHFVCARRLCLDRRFTETPYKLQRLDNFLFDSRNALR